MDLPNLKTRPHRPAVIIPTLFIIAIIAFVGVNHLVVRFREQQKALARHMFRRAESEITAGNRERAIDSFRVAVALDRGNDQYQLNLARALRDTGRTEESRSYLLSLWESQPEDSAINLALARLAARQNSVDDALRYYHNATYGVWRTNADSQRRAAQFELIDFLLGRNALPQAQAELITMSPAFPLDSDYHLRLGTLFAQARDNERALIQFQQVLGLNQQDFAALRGAGNAAFELGEYRSAQRYLSRTDPADGVSRERLRQTEVILGADPFERRISTSERERRVRSAFQQSGRRLDSCIVLKQSVSPADINTLKSRWLEMKFKLLQVRHTETDAIAVMDLVFKIEQATFSECGEPEGMDRVLLVLAQDREGAEQ